MINILPVIIGSILDSLIGDPHKMPHPIRAFGQIIAFVEKKINKGDKRFTKGLISAICLIIGVWTILFFIENFLAPFIVIKVIFSSIMFFYGICNRSLIAEAWKVEKALRSNNIELARKNLSYIVGRETHSLNETKIRLATLETLSENLSDGIVAPIFFYAIGGIPLMFAYKMVNTLDSMWGYKNDRFADFGKFAAYTDDVANYIPSRLTALIMWIQHPSKSLFYFIIKYRKQHSSPNSGYPEAALAGILDCRFGGTNIYHGKVVEKPYIGHNSRIVQPKDFNIACQINIITFIIMIVATIIIE